MTKKLKEELKKCSISVKWYNINEWQKEKYTNLLELVEQQNIKINNKYIITWDYGTQRQKTLSSFAEIERDLYTMLAQKCLYLGDSVKIKTRTKDWSF